MPTETVIPLVITQDVTHQRAMRAQRRVGGDCPSPIDWSPLNSDFTFDDGDLVLKTKRRKLAVVCGAPTRQMAPLDDDDYEVWALNVCFPRDSKNRIRADVWWEMHPEWAQSESDMAFISRNERPCCTVDFDTIDAPLAMPLPYEAMCAYHGWPVYFTCTMAFQLMWAIHLQMTGEREFEVVEMYGVELLLGNSRERTVEAACLSFWCGLAWGRFKLVMPDVPGCLIRSPYVYGYDYLAEARDVALLTNAHAMADMQQAEARAQKSQQ